jgi:hypothetical protein
MAVDLTGGMDDAREFVWDKQPSDPESRESMNAWIWDDSGEFGVPRIGVEAVADQWDTHDIQLNLAFSDGRVYNAFGPGPVHSAVDAHGRASVLGAGPLSFEVIEPFRHVKIRFDGPAVETTVEQQMEGWIPVLSSGPEVPVQLEIDLHPVLPPWENGSTSDEAHRVLSEQDEGAMVGYPWRFEQLCRATGTITVDGQRLTLNGSANRIRRQGVRRLATFRGHVWQAARFPDGRGFGFQTFPPRPDGLPTYNEGYVVTTAGALVPATVTHAPFLHELVRSGDDVSVGLATPDGEIEVAGTTLMSTFMIMPPEVGGGMQLQQALVRYTWEGQQCVGMLERSSLPDAMR